MALTFASFSFSFCAKPRESVLGLADIKFSKFKKKFQLTPEDYVKDVLKNDLESHLAEFNKPPKTVTPVNEDSNPGNASCKSDWLNRCRYDCRICNFETSSYSVFFNHIKVHNLSSKEYSEQNGGKLSSTTIIHTCQICGYIMDWERSNIGKHLNTKHNSVSPQDYIDMFMHSYTDVPELADNEEDKWMNQCQFECKECSTTSQFSTRNKLMLHLYKEHYMSMKEYSEKETSIISKFVSHVCKICNKSMRWDSDTITAHLDRLHFKTPKEYFEEHIKGNLSKVLSTSRIIKSTDESSNKPCPTVKWSDKCRFSCQICFAVLQSKNILKWHVHHEHNMYENYYYEHFASDALYKVTHGCLICGEEMLFDSKILKGHLVNCHNKMTDSEYKAEYYSKYSLSATPQDLDNLWIYRSLYNCKICIKIFKGKDQFKKHITSEHSQSFNSYSEIHGNGVFKERFHICLVEDHQGKTCSKQILWDGRSMTYHLSKHNLTPQDYCDSYMSKNEDDKLGKVVQVEKCLWANKCTFLCKICFKIFDAKSKLCYHIEQDHKYPVPDDSSIMDGVVNYKLHTCQICSENVMWEEASLKTHFNTKHNLPIEDYAAKHLVTYQENEICSKQIKEFGSWTTQCIYRCMLCPDKPEMCRKMSLFNHLSKKHRNQNAGYFTTFENETFVKQSYHVCQECGESILWDPKYLQKHIEQGHKMKTSVYRAKFMHRYTENWEEIERRRKEDIKQSKSFRKMKSSPSSSPQSDQESSVETVSTSLFEDEDFGMTEEVRVWARGCLYHCEICGSDFAGALTFEHHLMNQHRMSVQSYKRRHGANQACVMSGFHFCKLCSNNVRHDEVDLKNHFTNEHNMSVVEYFEKFRGKLRFPKLERPKVTRTTLNQTNIVNNNNSAGTKRKNSEDLSEDKKKRRTL